MTEILAAIVGAVVVGVVTRFQRKRRIIGWGMRTWQMLSTTGLQDRVQLKFQGKPVDVVWGTLVFAHHVGNDAIPAEAFAEPIRLATETTALLEVTLSGEAAGDGKVEVRAGEIIIAPRLINPGEALIISLMSDREIDSELYVRAVNTKLDYVGLNMDQRAMPALQRFAEIAIMVLLVGLFVLLVSSDPLDGGLLGMRTLIGIGILGMLAAFEFFLSRSGSRLRRFVTPKPWRY